MFLMFFEHLAYPIDSAIKAEIALFFATLAAYVETNLALKIGPEWLLVLLRFLSTLPCTARRNAQTAGEDYRRGLRSQRGLIDWSSTPRLLRGRRIASRIPPGLIMGSIKTINIYYWNGKSN